MSEQMRKDFEKWYSDDGAWPETIARTGSGYMYMGAEAAWRAWQAALATQPLITRHPQSYLKEGTQMEAPQAPQGGVTHGCHCDIEQGFEPDGCVLDEGNPNDCVYAMQILRKGQEKEACSYWRPIVIKPRAPTETPEAGK
jgi:hypothetical protein